MSQQRKTSSTRTLALAFMCLHLYTASVEANKYEGVILPSDFNIPKFQQLGCAGVYDKVTLTELDHVCEDCHNRLQYIDKTKLTPTAKFLCSQKCFSTEYFPACLELLLEDDKKEEYYRKVESLNGKGFDLTKKTNSMSPASAMESMIAKMSGSEWITLED